MKAQALVVVAALLSACGQSAPTQSKRPIVVHTDAQDSLHRLDDLNRAIALKRAIYDSGNSCKRIDKSGYVAEHRNLSMWTAHCDDGIDWAIFVGPDGSVQVRRCGDLDQLGLPACVISKGSAKAT